MFNITTQSGPPVQIGARKVTPQARLLQVRLGKGGAVWCIPSAVVVEERGETRRIPIIPVTLLLEVAMVALVVVTAAWTLRGARA